jgi:hypothetical protein
VDSASFGVKKNCAKNLDATICAHVDLEAAFKKCCLQSGKFDGSNRNYFFPRIALTMGPAVVSLAGPITLET